MAATITDMYFRPHLLAYASCGKLFVARAVGYVCKDWAIGSGDHTNIRSGQR
jgi:hypothetical protein